MEQYRAIWNNPSACCEEGKLLFFAPDLSAEERSVGFKLIERAARLGDPEAMFLLGRFLIEGRLTVRGGDSFDAGMAWVCRAANGGYGAARSFLNRICDTRYSGLVRTKLPAPHTGPLTDFAGKRIKIRRAGLWTPIDACLEYVEGKNILTLSTNLAFMMEDGTVADEQAFYRAVFAGIRAWQGEYDVFGGQKLTVRVELTADGGRLLDNLYILPLSNDLGRRVSDVWNRIGTEATKKRVNNVIDHKRSFAGIGLKKWSVTSRKIIVLQSESGRFDDYDEIRDVVKHEFGHALGLGDLYKSEVDGLPGVEKGSFRETDSYYLDASLYNLVMCDHHGPISNNDIEMVVLAFSRNRMQHYQPNKRLKGKISEALGKGN